VIELILAAKIAVPDSQFSARFCGLQRLKRLQKCAKTPDFACV
jgi:hypothetical protein